MREGIHPKFYKVKMSCSCGHTFESYSTKEKVHVDICSACHPFFTGKQKLMDTAGRVERFQKKYAKREEMLNKPKGPRTITINS